MNREFEKVRANYIFKHSRKSWTGGIPPPDDIYKTSYIFRTLVHKFFLEQLIHYYRFWGKKSLLLDTARIFWGRAKYDAWASMEEYAKLMDEKL